jgi:hypothetical protein
MLKKLKFKNIAKRFCIEVCGKSDCEHCRVREFSCWLEEHKDALHLFQKDYKYVMGPKNCMLNIHLLFDWEKCKNCDAMVYKSKRFEEVKKEIEQV